MYVWIELSVCHYYATNQCKKLPNCNRSLEAQENQKHNEYEFQSWWIKVLKKKKLKKKLLLLLHNIYVSNFFQVSFFFAQQPISLCYNSATKNQLEHTIVHMTLDGAQAQESPNG